MKEVAERRTHRRVQVEMWVRETHQASVYHHRASNLSVGGMFIDGTLPHKPGTRVELRFCPPGQHQTVAVLGQVLPGSGDSIGMHIRFVDVDDVVLGRITRAIVSSVSEGA